MGEGSLLGDNISNANWHIFPQLTDLGENYAPDTEGYLGIRFKRAGSYYYGWIKLVEVNNNYNCTLIKEIAVSSEPGLRIRLGDM